MSDERRQQLVDWYAGLSPEILPRIHGFYAADCHFHDPIHDFRGVEPLKDIYEQMFDNLQQPRFIMGAHAGTADQAFIAWCFEAGWRGRQFSLEGCSQLRYRDGLIIEHRDYWDAATALYERIPVLGGLLRALRRRLARH